MVASGLPGVAAEGVDSLRLVAGGGRDQEQSQDQRAHRTIVPIRAEPRGARALTGARMPRILLGVTMTASSFPFRRDAVKWDLPAVIAASALTRVAFLIFHSPGREEKFLGAARVILETGGYADPFTSLEVAPGYPLLLAGVLGITGGSHGAAIAVNHILGMAAAVLVYFCAQRLWKDRRLSLLAGLAAAVSTSTSA